MLSRSPVRAGRARLASERGWSLIVVLMILLATTLLSVAAYSAASGDIPLAAGDADSKSAYSAAEAGISYYLFHLNQDPQFWTLCTNVPAPGPGQPSPINQAWNGLGSDPRLWRSLPASSARYTIELLPANGFAQCDPTQPTQSMIDATQGTFRIRSTGRVNGSTRSVVATFRRQTFLDYLYFTDFETLDPVVYQMTNPSQQATLSTLCSQYRRSGRPEPPCTPIYFAPVDQVNGPMHTNDDILTCGSPVFGRSSADAIEIAGPAPGWQNGPCTAGTPNFLGTLKTSSPVLAMPPSNTALKTVPNAAIYTGTTTIKLNSNGTMNVTNAAVGLNNAIKPIPASGVIYDQNGACGVSYNLYQSYNDPAGCADLYVSGTTATSVTLASENDVIVTGNLMTTGAAEIGIVPNNFARVYHPVTNRSGNSCTNAAGTPTNIEIDAAILALQHSFIVDNYFCGAPLGTLTVKGAIAERFRGPVAQGGSSITSGYAKGYTYDDRLRYSMPPYFLSPVVSAWTLARYTEQIPATG
ncbi:MAG: pilus assembly PilX N-terminal domain-containing protein [Actinobacteria bacterium]|nr:pilus assembly PilX N-terminal domain-containing protein [Actinomycetota bacterium]